MSASNPLTPSVSIATSYQISTYPPPLAQGLSQAQQPLCSQTGVDQIVSPNPSPSN